MTATLLPNLLVAGVPKAGTTSLFDYLTQHPEICRGDKKEVGWLNYYNPVRHSGPIPALETYARHFSACRGERYRLDASPSYFYGGQPIIDAIQQLMPDARVIISLRNPVDRLWSAYTFQRSLGNINSIPSFDGYLKACQTHDPSSLVTGDHFHGYHIGFYGDHIPRWLDAFGDRLRIVFAENLSRNTETEVNRILTWLGLDPLETLNPAERNKTIHPRSTRLAKLVFAAKRAGDRANLFPKAPAIRLKVRQVYERLNSGSSAERLSPEQRRTLEVAYRDSTIATARILTDHGYTNLPRWLVAPA